MLFIMYCLIIVPVSYSRLKIYWDDISKDDLVKEVKPGQDVENVRIAVAFVNQELKFTCKVDEASEISDIEFYLPSATVVHGGQTNTEVLGKHYMEREGSIEKVTEEMDGEIMRCKYNKPGGESASVNLIISVWTTTMTAEKDVCKDKNGDIEVMFHEANTPKPSETNVINRVKDKAKDDVDVTLNDKLTVQFDYSAVQDNNKLREINDVIISNGKGTDGTECFLKEDTQENDKQVKQEAAMGMGSIFIVLIVVAVICIVVGGIGVVWWKKKDSYKKHSDEMEKEELSSRSSV